MAMRDLIVVCGVAIDERNGGGMRVVIDHLEALPETTQIISLHLGEGLHEGLHSLRSVRYVPLQRGRGLSMLPRLILNTRRALNAFSPNTARVLCLPNSSADVVMSWAATTTHLPVDVWFMDDFLGARRDPLGAKQILLNWFYAQLYKCCDRRIVIGAAMRDEYARRYGAPAELVLGKAWKHADIERAYACRRRRAAPDRDAPLQLVWIGTYLPYYKEPLCALARILRARPELPITLDLYGLYPPGLEALVSNKIRYRGPFRDSELPELLAHYDYGLVCYSGDPYTVNFMRLSFPGKLVDYICAGLAVAAVVPSQIEFRKELERARCHVVSESISETGIVDWINRLRASREAPPPTFAQALQFAKEENVRRLFGPTDRSP
jgi:hypothetical protein